MADSPQPLISIPETGNPRTLARFRREAWWQITFPVVLVAVLSIGGLVYLLLRGGPPAVSIVADYSLILLIILALVAGLIGILAVFGLIYAVSLLIQKTPPYTYAVQQLVEKIYRWVDKQTDRIAGVVITARSVLVGINYYLRTQGIIPEDSAESGGTQESPDPPRPH